MPSSPSPSFPGTSSPVFTSVVAQAARKHLPGPRSPRTESRYQLSSNKNGSKVRSDAGSFPDRTGRLAGPPKSSRSGGVVMAGLFPIETGRANRASKGRRKSANDSGSPSSPQPRVVSHDSSYDSPVAFQAHHRHHESSAAEFTNRRLLHGQLQVPTPSEPVETFLPLPSSSLLPSPSKPPPRRQFNRAAIASSPLAHSFDDHRATTPASSTPKSPLRPRSTRSTPSRRPHSSIRRALVPIPAAPTLAISMQIHAPAPILSTRPSSPHTNMLSSPRSGASSPLTIATQLPLTRPPMPRPPSRSERLLRDTLRRAEEHDRQAALAALPSPSLFGATQPAHGFVPSPPSGRRSRRNTSSSVNTDGSIDAFAYCDTGACYSDDDEGADDNNAWSWRSPSVSSSSSGHGYFYQGPSRAQPPLPRHNSDDRETRRRGSMRSGQFDDIANEETSDDRVYGSPSSPSRQQLQRSARSAPSVSRSSVSHSRTSHAQSASRSPPDPERAPCGCPQAPAVTPHEAVLRSRLEGVLRGAKIESERRRSREREYHTGSSGSMASSRNMSGEDWFFAAAESTSPMSHRSELPSLSHSTRTRASTNAPAPSHARTHRSPSTASPLTPPPTPPFNARVAAAQCKAMDGYVSFADIQGLGVPDGEVDALDDADKHARGGWRKWLPVPLSPRMRSEDVASR